MVHTASDFVPSAAKDPPRVIFGAVLRGADGQPLPFYCCVRRARDGVCLCEKPMGSAS